MAIDLAGRRLEIDKVLRSIVKQRCGEENVYYQPPTGLKMRYPCICYERSRIGNEHADGRVYRQTAEYTVTVIDTKPDSLMTANVSVLERCAYVRRFISDNLYHDVFTIWN